MSQIRFRLPAGCRGFHPDTMSEDSKAHGSDNLYRNGLAAVIDIPPGMRVPLVGESVTVPGSTFTFTVHDVQHYFAPDDNDGDDFEPYAYVVLR